MKPSEIITNKMQSLSFDDALLDYLDEEAEKPKYACPNCHRIVDELIPTAIEGHINPDGSMVFNLSATFSSKYMYNCKYCNNMEIKND